jgi:uncharacterized protein
MQFLVMAYDGKDENALVRRMEARPAHIAGIEKMKAEKRALYGAAILDENDKMIGSVMIVDFKTRTELDAWLQSEPYVTQRVWQKIEVFPCKVPPLFSAEAPVNGGNIR